MCVDSLGDERVGRSAMTPCCDDFCQFRGHCYTLKHEPGKQCSCNPGFAGPSCGECDAAGGFVSDGNGGCVPAN